MKEIRLHGIGGMGTVKAGEILVHETVKEGKYGNSMPFFGFERQGAPVTSFVRLDDKPIRPKNKVYQPDCVIVLDPSLLVSANVFEGLNDNSIFVVNSRIENLEAIKISDRVARIAYVDATDIAMELLNRAIPNTIMLGAFARATGWAERKSLEEVIVKFFGEKNREAFRRGYDEVKVIELGEGQL